MMIDSLSGQTGDQVTLLSPKKEFLAHSYLTFSYHMLLTVNDTFAALTVYRSVIYAFKGLLFQH